jgi:DNA sulfur modification protein DndD
MLLYKITLKDFRQFKNIQTIDFSRNEFKNVTVIYGENGRGKTGIFRALIYCLYGDRSLSQDELKNEAKKKGLGLVNEVSLKENIGTEIESSVTINFSHLSISYSLTRKVKGLMKTDGEIIQNSNDDVELQIKDKDGNTKPIETDEDKIKTTIQKILNERLRDYFLFDGERIERLTKNTDSKRGEVRKGIRALLDLDAMELSIKGLDKLVTEKERDIKNKATGELKKISEAIVNLNGKIEELTNEIESSDQEKNRIEHQITKISEEIGNNEETAEQERILQKFIQNREDLITEKDLLQQELKSNLNRSGQLIADDLLEQLRQELDSLRNKGQLPPDIRQEFVEKLLAQKKCICGNQLDDEHLQARKTLQVFIKEQYRPGLGKESEDLLYALNRTCSANEDLSTNFSRSLIKNKKLNDEIKEIGLKIKTLNEQLDGCVTSVDELIQERKRLENEKVSLKSTVDRNKYQLEEAETKLNDYRKESNKLEKQQSLVTSLVDRRNLCEDTLKHLNNIYNKFADDVKLQLAQKSTEIFNQLADNETLKDIKKIDIDNNYLLDVLNWSGHRRLGEISAGQRQIVSLSFIMALIQVAGELEVPLFMDTPFGRLSGTHRDHLIESIPKMASQWILLATDTEFTTVEAEALKKTGNWGSIYELVKKQQGVTEIVQSNIDSFSPKRKSFI